MTKSLLDFFLDEPKPTLKEKLKKWFKKIFNRFNLIS